VIGLGPGFRRDDGRGGWRHAIGSGRLRSPGKAEGRTRGRAPRTAQPGCAALTRATRP